MKNEEPVTIIQIYLTNNDTSIYSQKQRLDPRLIHKHNWIHDLFNRNKGWILDLFTSDYWIFDLFIRNEFTQILEARGERVSLGLDLVVGRGQPWSSGGGRREGEPWSRPGGRQGSALELRWRLAGQEVSVSTWW